MARLAVIGSPKTTEPRLEDKIRKCVRKHRNLRCKMIKVRHLSPRQGDLSVGPGRWCQLHSCSSPWWCKLDSSHGCQVWWHETLPRPQAERKVRQVTTTTIIANVWTVGVCKITSSGRLRGWPSGPVIPIPSILLCSWTQMSVKSYFTLRVKTKSHGHNNRDYKVFLSWNIELVLDLITSFLQHCLKHTPDPNNLFSFSFIISFEKGWYL